MASAADNVQHLLTILEIAQAHAPEDAAAWFADGVDEFMAGSHLDDALKLKAEPGSRHAADAYRTWKRNSHLIAAHRYVIADSDWQRSIELERLAREFETLYWPSVCEQKEPPAHWSELRKELFHAFACGIGTPRKRQLHDIVQRNIVRRATASGRIDFLSLSWTQLEKD